MLSAMNRTLVWILFLVALPAGAGTQGDICKSGNPVEKAVNCIYDSLGKSDASLKALYAEVSGLMNPAEQRELQESQKKWIAERDRCSDNPKLVDCIHAAYEKRQKELAELRAGKMAPPILAGNPTFRKASRDGKVVFFDMDDFDAYDKLPQQWTLARESMEMTKDAMIRSVKTCSEFVDARSSGYDTGPGRAGEFKTCDLLRILQKVRKPKMRLNEKKLLGQLWLHFSAEPGSVVSGANLTKGKPVVSSMGFSIEDETTSEMVRVLALSDFDADGREDVLLSVVHAYKGAAHWYYEDEYQVLTLKNGEKDFSVIALSAK